MDSGERRLLADEKTLVEGTEEPEQPQAMQGVWKFVAAAEVVVVLGDELKLSRRRRAKSMDSSERFSGMLLPLLLVVGGISSF